MRGRDMISGLLHSEYIYQGVFRMSATNVAVVNAGAREVHAYLRDALSHVELVSEDVFENEDYIAVMLYQQYFMRAKNRAALMVVVSGRQGEMAAKVKTVATGSSEGLIFDFDWGAADAFAHEPISLLRDKFETREQ